MVHPTTVYVQKKETVHHLLGLLRVRVLRGVKLAIRDAVARSSDPYVILGMGKQMLKTRVIKKTLNPEWNEDLTLYVEDPSIPVRLEVYDKDMIRDDPLGHAEFDIQPLVEAVKKNLGGIPNNKIITKVTPSRQNCLAEESPVYWWEGKVVQDMSLRLKHVETGWVELQLEWVSIPSSKGL